MKYFISINKIALSLFIILFSISCSLGKDSIEVVWSDELDYFTDTEAFYFVDVGTKSAYLGGVLEIYRLIDSSYVDRLTVTDFDLLRRGDGYPICRIWGISGKNNEVNYLLARNCLSQTVVD
ncbi:hypothetical protein N9T42_02170 [SAR86 cluster bacterium]|jgi:hypothetical protein|nr:hypothetical protein [SAR86 cluster bacterium]